MKKIALKEVSAAEVETVEVDVFRKTAKRKGMTVTPHGNFILETLAILILFKDR